MQLLNFTEKLVIFFFIYIYTYVTVVMWSNYICCRKMVNMKILRMIPSSTTEVLGLLYWIIIVSVGGTRGDELYISL